MIGPDKEMIGVVETSEALRMAQERGMDLVEVNPEQRPPLCQIMDYGKYKYELSKKEAKQRAGSRAAEMKEIRLGRSVKIDKHDVEIRIDQARRFLMGGHKVMVTQKFRGREIAHKDIGLGNLKKVADALMDLCRLEQAPRWFGKQASIIVAPDKTKVDAIKRKLDKERAEKLARGEKVEEEKTLEQLDAELAAEKDHDEGDEE